MQIEFECIHCGKVILADAQAIGHSAKCAACGKTIRVPSPRATPPPNPPAPRRPVLHVPRDLAAKTQGGTQKLETVAPSLPIHEHRRTMEIVVGWVCVIVGILLALLLPRAVLVYMPFFVGAFMMALVLFHGGKVLHAIVMLLCTCIPPPLLMHENIWRHAPKADTTSAEIQQLKFTLGGDTKLVPAAPQVQYVQVAPAAPAEAPASMSPPVERRKRPPRPPPGPDTNASMKSAQDVLQPPDDPYKKLLEEQSDVPPLVPEDVLNSTMIGRNSDFLWQTSTALSVVSPDDPAPVAPVPFAIYDDSTNQSPYVPSGRMGNNSALEMDPSWDVDPHAGKTCMRMSYTLAYDWATIAWQNPPNNWGDIPGGFDFSKATKLTFWAKGDKGGEKAEFMVGTEQAQTAVARDSLRATTGMIRLPAKWKKFSIPIGKDDRSRLITPFLVRVEGQSEPIAFYLDDIQFE